MKREESPITVDKQSSSLLERLGLKPDQKKDRTLPKVTVHSSLVKKNKDGSIKKFVGIPVAKNAS